MLGKLAFRNAKRSLKDYFIYLITITLSFSLIFSFQLVSSSEGVVRLSEVMKVFGQIMYFVNVLIVFVICFLINYTTKFMFEKRSREFGMYLLLGIAKKEVAKEFCLENLMMGFLALIFSIPVGFVISQFMSLVIVNIFGIPDLIFISIDGKSVLLLLLYFAVVYVLVLFNMLKRMRRMTVRHFLYLEQQNEEKMLHSKRYRFFFFGINLILGLLGIGIWRSIFQIERLVNPNAAYYLMGAMLMLIASIYGISVTLSDMILSFVLNRKNIKYTKDNLFVARTFSSKVRSMSMTFGTLAMLITITLVALNIAYITKGMYDYLLESSAPYDFITFDDQSTFDEYMEIIEEDYTVNTSYIYKIYKEPLMQIESVFPYGEASVDFDCLLKESDYNMLLKMRGMEEIDLQENEYMIVTGRGMEHYFQNNAAIKQVTLQGGRTLGLKEITSDGWWYRMNYLSDYLMIVPDSCVEGLEIALNYLVVDTKEETTGTLEEKIVNHMEARSSDETERDNAFKRYMVTVRGKEREEYNGVIAMMSSVCLYVAFIFISTAGTIFAIQSLSDSAKYKYRYRMLKRLGISDGALHATIRKQLAILFFVPVFYPVLISFSIVSSINHVYHIFLESQYRYLVYFAGGLGIFLMVYAVYFIAAYTGFKRNVHEGS